MHHFIINWPKSMEIKHLLIPWSCWLHFTIWLIAHTVIDMFEFYSFYQIIDRLNQMMFFISWQENSGVFISLYESVSSVSISFNCRYYYLTFFILQNCWLLNWFCTSINSFFEYTCWVIYCKGNIFNSISMLSMMRFELILSIGLVYWSKSK